MATLTINHYINQSNSFIADIRNNRNAYYVFASRSQPWANSTGGNDDSAGAVLASNNSVSQVEQTLYNNLLFGKLLRDEDVINVIPRYNWTSGTVYAPYDQTDANLYDKQFYVVTDEYEVYKCIDNNNGATSTVKPSLTSASGTFKTGDGYVWKYMYSISSSANAKFTTSEYIPVEQDLIVQGNATPGSIDLIRITDGGNGYSVFETGYISGVDERGSRIQLPLTSSSVNNYYANSSIYLKSGFGAGQIREIAGYDGSTKQIVVAGNSLDLFTRLELANAQGTIEKGYYVQQRYDDVRYLYSKGYFNANSLISQSDTGVSGRVIATNTSVIQVIKNNQEALFLPILPIVDTSQAGTLETGVVAVGNVGACNVGIITIAGSGYLTNSIATTITPSGLTGSGAVANAQVNSSGKVSSILISTPGSGYFTAPTITIPAPTAQTFNADTSVTAGTGAGANNVITLGSSLAVTANTTGVSNTADVLLITNADTFLGVGNIVFYSVPTGNTAIPNLIANTFYYVSFVNSSAVAVSATPGGANVDIAETRATAGQTHRIISGTAHRLSINDTVTYIRTTGTSNIGLTNNATYLVEFANQTVVALKSTPTGSRIALTKGTSETGHAIRGQTATAAIFADNQVVRGTANSFNVTANTTGVSNTADTLLISSANSFMAVNDVVYYNVPAGNITIPNLTANTFYFVTFANTTAIALSTTRGGANVNIAETRTGAGQVHQILTGTVLDREYAVGDYIRVGANTTSNIRRIANVVNTSALVVTTPFGNTFTATANDHFRMLVAAEVESTPLNREANGFILDTNLTSLQLAISNSQRPGIIFTVGENVKMTNLAGNGQGPTAIVAFANSSTVILSSVTGAWAANNGGTQFYISGDSSLQFSKIDDVVSNPNITIEQQQGLFKLGYPVFFKANAETVSLSGNATIIAQFGLPNDMTEYQIGPTVKITGDGSNAIGIAVVNTATNSVREIVGIDMINPGFGYTQANVEIYAGNNYGSGAKARAIISPVAGHGHDPITELGARYVGVSSKFDSVANESYEFPGYGKFRQIGILENPQFKDITVRLTDFDRVNMTLANYSGSWVVGEVVTQPTTDASGVIVSGNSIALQLKSVKGTFSPSNTIVNLVGTDNVFLTLTGYGGNTNWAVGEVLAQPSTKAAGVVVSGNTTTVMLKDVKGTFSVSSTVNGFFSNSYATVSQTNNTHFPAGGINGFFSNTTANVVTSEVIRFPVGNSAAFVTQSNSGSTGVVTQVINTTAYSLSNVVGQFADGDIMYDNVVNAYATVESIFTANNTRDVSASFGNRFNQTARITLTTKSGEFQNDEYVQQEISLARGRVVSTANELDLVISSPTNSIFIGQTITDETTNANGICVFANSTYIKLSAVSQDLSFVQGHTINNGLGSTATIDRINTVLVLNDVSDVNNFQAGSNNIVGLTSGARGTCNNHLLIEYPDLVRDSGKLIYSESFTPVERSPTNKEEVKLVIKF